MVGIIPVAKPRKLFNIDQSAGKPLTLAFVHAETAGHCIRERLLPTELGAS
jgi:hypothetical protein